MRSKRGGLNYPKILLRRFPLVKKSDKKTKVSFGIVPESIPEIVPESIPEKVTEKQKKILEIMAANPHVSMQEIAQVIGIAERNIKVHIKKLKDTGRVKRVGPDKGGHWEVVY
ncbi:MAG: winged helix-turn-helix domain-containing protein [Candidatus Omnitrophica bacterium]|nr:winged helix-turn-helix domain-containing protein [Candidatus Omnitrophota bacterium]